MGAIALVTFASLAASALATIAAKAPPDEIRVPAALPYYGLLQAQQAPQVGYGEVVGGCTIVPRTSCRGAMLPRRALNGALLVLSDLSGLDLHGGSLALAALSFAGMNGADLRNANLIDSSMAYGQFRRANMSGTRLTFAGITNADLRGANLTGGRGGSALDRRQMKDR